MIVLVSIHGGNRLKFQDGIPSSKCGGFVPFTKSQERNPCRSLKIQ